MRKFCSSYLIVCLLLAACADHGSSFVADNSGPQAPINEPDDGVFQPGTGSGPTELLPEPEGPIGNHQVGSSAPDVETGGNSGQAGGGGGSNAGEGGGGSNPGEEPEGGGQPVPEPSTLLLVGSGLAGAALLRRRRKPSPAV